MQALLLPIIEMFMRGFLNQSATVPTDPAAEARELEKLEKLLRQGLATLNAIIGRIKERRINLAAHRADNADLRKDIKDIIKQNLATGE